jgi:predicted TIM-barrel fold metal-dependent hydrolase
MKLEAPDRREAPIQGIEGLAIIDCDFHNSNVGRLEQYLSPRWREYAAMMGRRHIESMGCTTQGRPLACRLDTFPADGGPPGSDRELAREQLLDEYGLTAAVINNLEVAVSGNAPVEFEIDLARATNDCHLEEWLAYDERFVASINVPLDHPEAAAKEIERCCEMSDRFVQVILGSRGERPQGNPKYWPMYEAAAHYNIPVAYHVGVSKYHHWSGAGPIEYYFEIHTGFPQPMQAAMSSLIFEGVFDRFPTLKIVAVELGWEWAVPFAWRLDSSWRVMRSEVPHLQRKPSDYVRDHFYFSTQPQVEPENPVDFFGVCEQFEEFGLTENLMFATDYPHWDMDSPFEAIPPFLPRDFKEKILATNASKLYGIDLDRVSAGA